jgi:DNA-directed RNA polymerase subunit RPC12/RpoP
VRRAYLTPYDCPECGHPTNHFPGCKEEKVMRFCTKLSCGADISGPGESYTYKGNHYCKSCFEQWMATSPMKPIPDPEKECERLNEERTKTLRDDAEIHCPKCNFKILVSRRPGVWKVFPLEDKCE